MEVSEGCCWHNLGANSMLAPRLGPRLRMTYTPFGLGLAISFRGPHYDPRGHLNSAVSARILGSAIPDSLDPSHWFPFWLYPVLTTFIFATSGRIASQLHLHTRQP